MSGRGYCRKCVFIVCLLFSIFISVPGLSALKSNAMWSAGFAKNGAQAFQPEKRVTKVIAPCIDSDGDGWGWDGQKSCKMVELPADNYSAPASTQQINNVCLDPDGDGWGWDGQQSCKVGDQPGDNQTRENQLSVAPASHSIECIDPDGDGWGWNGTASCRVGQSNTTTTHQIANHEKPAGNGQCRDSYTPADITDVVLITGQSNVTGADTEVSATFDRWGKVVEFHPPDEPHARVFAWTVAPFSANAGNGWKTASLDQSWHDSAPGVGGTARNSFAFHFAKNVVERDGCRAVGIIVVSEGGKGIAHWDHGATGFNEVSRQVNDALSAIGRTSIDGFLWHQGESDWIADGTCFNTPRCENGRPDYYPQKLYSAIADKNIPNRIGQQALIDRLRREPWFGAHKPFIAGKTVKAPVNVHLNKLNTDGDPWTACVESDISSGLSIRKDDPFGNHYNAEGLRGLGALYAAEYMQMTGGQMTGVRG